MTAPFASACRYLFLFILCSFVSASIRPAFAQQSDSQYFWNNDFEYAGYKSQPRKWSIEGEGESYDARLDSTVKKSGAMSLSLSLKRAKVNTILSIPGSVIAGRTLRIEGHVLSQQADSLQAMFIFLEPGGGTLATSEQAERKEKEWQAISLEASIPATYSSDRILVALVASGTGRFWFDDVHISIDGREYGIGEPDFREPTAREVNMLNRKAVPIKPPAATAAYDDLEPLSEMVGDARIVGLGENSHGSSSIFKLKHRMLKYLVEEQGFSVFALEMPAVEADDINEYVLYGKGSVDEVLRKLTYPSWQNREIMDLIQWMKNYNSKHAAQLQFRGFDMQNGWSALAALKDFARDHDPDLEARLAEVEELYGEAMERGANLETVYHKSKEVSGYLSSQSYEGAEARDAAAAGHYMDIFMQGLSFYYPTEDARSRDAYLAENIGWLLDHAGDDVKMIVSADNTHVTKADGKMGNFLSKRYGPDYLPVGITYGNGTYAAYGPEEFYKVHAPYVGTYEYVFSKSEHENFILNLRDGRDIPILNESAGFRTIGSRPQEVTQFIEMDLKDHFDMVIYLDRSAHTVPLKK